MDLTASKSASIEKLNYFLSNNITNYENNRNFDFGPQNQKIVSCLSPYITHRILLEYDVIKKVLSTNTWKNSEKQRSNIEKRSNKLRKTQKNN